MALSKRRDTRATLRRKIKELEAQLSATLHFADIGIQSADMKRTMGSAVIISMHYLGGKEVCPTFAIRDGLSSETIAAIRADIRRSYELATMFKPAPAKE